ncbi:MAG: hypothetical protein GX675_01840 [Erysipelotrichaceae bacterium]|nr:hypothetical protein [Erysipelotrichaceae bacterium]
MYKIFNINSLSSKSRFTRGLIAGSITAIVLAIAYGFLSSLIAVQFSLAFVGIGYLIGNSIKYFGHGVKPEFAIMGAVLTLICIILSDFISFFGFSSIFNFAKYPEYISIYLRVLLRTDINSLLSLAFRAGGVYAGYIYSRIV